MLYPKVIIGTATLFFMLGLFLNPAEAQRPEFYPEIGEEIMVTGEIVKVKMTNFPDNPWEETAIKTEDEQLYILIGSLVTELKVQEGEKVTITGVLKPKMRVKGELTRTIEIKSVDKIEDKAEEE